MWPRRHYRRGGGGGGLGLILLAMQFMNLWSVLSRTNEFLPITLGVIGLNVIMFLQPGNSPHWPSTTEGCISVRRVWFQQEWKRVLVSPFLHASDWHLYYNMASFMWKAVTLERHFGSGYFAYMIVVFSVATNFLYLGINLVLAEFLNQWSYVESCAVGFSGVIFALKVVTTHLQRGGMSRIMGFFPIPTKYAVWAELVLISVLFPNVSFVGHLCGILVGLAFVHGPLQTIMDLPLPFLNDMAPGVPAGEGERRAYDYAARATGRRPYEADRPGAAVRRLPNRDWTQYTYASEATGHRGGGQERREEEEEELQEAIRRSLGDQQTPQPGGHHGNEGSDVDRDLQAALERSMQDNHGTGDSDPPYTRPPPYNPDFVPVEQRGGSDDAAGVREEEARPSQSLRRRNISQPSVNEAESTSSGRVGGGLSQDELRAVRLQRFGSSQSRTGSVPSRR